MFEKISRAAERTASSVSLSRRGFLGRLGRTALVAAGVVGGLLAFSKDSKGQNRVLYNCVYCSVYGPFYSKAQCGTCSPAHRGHPLCRQSILGAC
jgi:hypothetical protein